MQVNAEHNKALGLVLPCYNPPSGWEDVVIEKVKHLETLIGVPIHLTLVNDGSTERFTDEMTSKIEMAIDHFNLVSYAENRGKGFALRAGVEEVIQDKIIFTDIDFPYLDESFVAIYQTLMEGNDVALGHRGKDYYDKTPWFRKIVSKTLRWFLKTFLRLPTDDSQCGIKGFNKKGATIFLETKIDRFLFDLEFIKLASKRKLEIKTTNVQLKPDVVFSKVGMGIILREGLNFLKVLFRK